MINGSRSNSRNSDCRWFQECFKIFCYLCNNRRDTLSPAQPSEQADVTNDSMRNTRNSISWCFQKCFKVFRYMCIERETLRSAQLMWEMVLKEEQRVLRAEGSKRRYFKVVVVLLEGVFERTRQCDKKITIKGVFAIGRKFMACRQ